MHESEVFEPVESVDYVSGYSNPEVYTVTGNAVLYRVRKAGKYFIIKTPKDGFGQSVAMLQREYELSLGKSHPNIVDVFTYEPQSVVGPGIVMEYVDGRVLTDFLAENPSLAVRERVFTQLLQAVAYVHRCGVVHNDIKPENILVTRADNDVRLIDFGLADDDAHYLARTPGCTPAYASPELLAREKDVDARSDIYSLGMIMHDIFGNRYLRITGRCLCAQCGRRYANAEELLEAFRHRNRPAVLLALLMVALPLLVLLLFGFYGSVNNRRKIVAQETVAEQKTAVRDSLLAQVEKDVTVIYERVADSVSCAPYFEFANNNILSFYEMMGEYNERNISSIADPDLNAVLSIAYTNRISASVEQLWEKAKLLPSIYKSGLSPIELMYYDSLYAHRLPFVPYHNK